MDRRKFLGRTLQGAALLAVGGCTVPPRAYRVPGPLQGPIRVPLREYPELAEPGGLVKVVLAGHGAVYLRREADGRFIGISGVCTHQGCTVSPRRGGFQCPCHGARYDATGAVVRGPAKRPLRGYAAERVGDAVLLNLNI